MSNPQGSIDPRDLPPASGRADRCRSWPHWAPILVGAALALGLGLLIATCSAPQSQSTPTPSALARLLVGKWAVTAGESPKSQVVLGEQVALLADGAYTWGKQDGQYSVFEDRSITLRSTYGEKLEYLFTLSGDTLTLSRGTSCGKEERYVLQRAR